MTRLTEKELAALESAKRAPIKLDEITIDTRRGLLGNAHQLRAEFVAEQARGLGRSLRSLPVVYQVSEWAGARRRYRTTLRELSRLDRRGLDDLGISPGEIRTIARRAAGIADRPKAGFFTRLQRSISTASQRRRTVRELAALSPQMLRDIGIDRDDIQAYLRGEVDLINQRPPAPAAAPAAVAVDMLIPNAVQIGALDTTSDVDFANEEALAA